MENRPMLAPIRVNASAAEVDGVLTVALSLTFRDSRRIPDPVRTITWSGANALSCCGIKAAVSPVSVQVRVDTDGLFTVGLPPVICTIEPGVDTVAVAGLLNGSSTVVKLSGLTVSNSLVAENFRMSVQINTDLNGWGSSNFYYDKGCTLFYKKLYLCTDTGLAEYSGENL